MKRFLPAFLIMCVLFSTLSISVFAQDLDGDGDEDIYVENDYIDYLLDSYGENVYCTLLFTVLGQGGLVIADDMGVEYAESGADIIFDVLGLDLSIGDDATLQSIEDAEEFLNVVVSGNSISEEFCNAVLEYIENSDLLDYKVAYTVSCYDVSTANWTNIAQWNIMTNAASPKLDGNGDDQSFLNPDFPVDSQIYAVGRNTYAGQLYFANVSGLSFVCSTSSVWENVLNCNFDAKGSDGDIGRVNFYDSSGATASVEQYDFMYPYDTALKYHLKISNWVIRYTDDSRGYYFHYFVDGGTERQPILFFENVQALNAYISGQSSVYQIPSNYQGGDMIIDTNIDYRELYDAISAAIASGDYLTATEIQKAVEEAASEYLDRIAQNTADINDALRDQEGNSWLRRISGALDDLAEGFQEYSFSMISEIKSGFAWIKTELAAILAVGVVDLVWEEVEEDIQNAVDIAQDLTDLATSKFPFSIPRDIGLLLTMFRAEPVEPIFEIPFNFMGEETVVILDLTFAEDFLPYVHGGFILLFIVGLFGLSIKIIPIMSGGA